MWLRVSTSLLSVLHFAVLGTVLPMLPLYLRSTLRLSWTQTGIAFAALPLGLVFSPLIERHVRRIGLDARSGLAISHLLAAGLAMTAAGGLVPSKGQPASLWIVCGGLLAYSIALSPALLWLPQATGKRDGLSSTSWRLWGAIGFVAPAWLLETVLIRSVELHDRIQSHEILPAVAGWVGAFAVVAALMTPGEPLSRAKTVPESRAGHRSYGLGFVLSLVLIVVVQRCNQLWTAPLIEFLTVERSIEIPLIHRLATVSQVFEAIGLYGLAGLLVILRPRFTACLGALTWMAKAMLVGWVTQSDLPQRETLTWLFLAQTLQGFALIGFYGGLAALAGRDVHRATAGRTALLGGVAGAVGLVAAGALTESLLSVPGGVFREAVTRLPASIEVGGCDVTLRGWPAVWWLSSVPALIAAVVVLFAGRQTDPDEE